MASVATDQVRVEKVIAFARAQIGKPYVFGSAGPNSWDCSGLTMMAYKQIGINLAHSTYINVTQGRAVRDKSQLQPGDLILPHPGHIQLYIGGGKVIEAYDTGYPVRVSSVSRVWRIRRFLSDGLSGTSSGGTIAGGNVGGSDSTSDNSGASGFSNPLDLGGIDDAISVLADPNTWIRIGMFLAGALAIIVGLMSVTKGR